MLEGCFQDSGRISNDAFVTYRFFLQPRRDKPFKRRETRNLALRDFGVQVANLFPILCSLTKSLLLPQAAKGAKMLPLASPVQLQRITVEVFVPHAFNNVLANQANSDVTLLASRNAPNSGHRYIWRTRVLRLYRKRPHHSIFSALHNNTNTANSFIVNESCQGGVLDVSSPNVQVVYCCDLRQHHCYLFLIWCVHMWLVIY